MSVESASNFVKPEIKDIKIIGQENLKVKDIFWKILKKPKVSSNFQHFTFSLSQMSIFI